MKAIQIRNFNYFSLSCLVTLVLNMMFMEIDDYFRLGHTCFTIDNHLRTTWKQVKISHKVVRYSQNKVMEMFPNMLNRKPLFVYNTTCVSLLIHLLPIWGSYLWMKNQPWNNTSWKLKTLFLLRNFSHNEIIYKILNKENIAISKYNS